MLDRKALTQVRLKAGDSGEVEAVFATFNVRDHDGDVTVPGAFQDGAPVRISAYNHGSSLGPSLPVGKGSIRVTDEAAVMSGKFFLDTTQGRDTFTVVKEMGDLQEWSYAYDILDAEMGTHEGQPAQFLRQLVVNEVSPVLLGAGIGTRTLSTKSAIPFRGSGTVDESWSGSTNERHLSNDAGASTYRRMYAWVDPDGDPDAKSSYKFPHHMVSTEGSVGAANVRACIAGIAVLNGGRGGTTIPSADRRGVYNHLARHLRDADRDPPPLRDSSSRPLAGHAVEVLSDVLVLTERLEEIKSMRTEKGKDLGKAGQELAAELEEHCKRLRDVLAIEPQDTTDDKEMGARLYAESVRRGLI